MKFIEQNITRNAEVHKQNIKRKLVNWLRNRGDYWELFINATVSW